MIDFLKYLSPVLFVLLGYALSYLSLFIKSRIDRDMEKEKKKFEFLEKQLKEFYGQIFFYIEMNKVISEIVDRVVEDNKSGMDRFILRSKIYNVHRPLFSNEDVFKLIKENFHLIDIADRELCIDFNRRFLLRTIKYVNPDRDSDEDAKRKKEVFEIIESSIGEIDKHMISDFIKTIEEKFKNKKEEYEQARLNTSSEKENEKQTCQNQKNSQSP